MAILSTVKKILPYIKTATGYVLCRLSSQGVEMDDGTTLQDSYESLNNTITLFKDRDSTVENSPASSGRTLKIYNATDNLMYGCYDEGLYIVNGYSAGAPNDWGGSCLTTLVRGSNGSVTQIVKTFFSADCKVYVMRQSKNGDVEQNWTTQS